MIPYIGDKSVLSNFISPYIPESSSIYVEPFSGMFGLFLSLDMSDYKFTDFIYNDINYLNYNLFDKLKNSNFIESINNLNVSLNDFQNSHDYIKVGKDDLGLAKSWLIILTCSYPSNIKKWKSNIGYDIFKSKYSYYEEKISSITNIHNKDYKEVIKEYDSSQTFFYIDPPYKDKESYYINHKFDTNSHKELSEELNKIKGKFMISYYYFDGIKELYPNCEFVSKKVKNGATEYLIMNY